MTQTTQLVQKFNNRFATKHADTKGYTPYAWKGNGYDSSIGIKEIAKVIRQVVKEQYPTVKTSVRISRYSMGQSLSVDLMEAPFEVFNQPDQNKLRPIDMTWGIEDAMQRWERLVQSGHMSVNQYYINDSIYLTDEAKKFFGLVRDICDYFNYDDSDAMTDYFSTNFYYSIGVGKWDKPFKKN